MPYLSKRSPRRCAIIGSEVGGIRQQINLRGRVFSGLGQGAYFTGLDWVGEQCREKLGFTPFPGTLNLRADPAALAALRLAANAQGVEITPPTADFCPARALPLSLNGEPAAAILPQAEDFAGETHGSDVIEVIAPLALKEKLNLRDGDAVSLSYQVEAL